MAIKLWLPLILVLSVAIIETNSWIPKKLTEWKDQCQKVFGQCKIIFETAKKYKKEQDFHAWRRSGGVGGYPRDVQDVLDCDMETLISRFTRLKGYGKLKTKAVTKVIRFCTRTLGKNDKTIQQLEENLQNYVRRYNMYNVTK